MSGRGGNGAVSARLKRDEAGGGVRESTFPEG